jgi:hypothetical protein
MTEPDDTDLIPSTTTCRAWLYARSSVESFATWEPDLPGKWCVGCSSDDVDDAWQRIRTAVASGKLAAAKVSTALTSYGGYAGRFVICVYNRTWRDDAEIYRSRDVLAELGFTGEHVLGYKRDIETTRGVYGGPEEWYRRW